MVLHTVSGFVYRALVLTIALVLCETVLETVRGFVCRALVLTIASVLCERFCIPSAGLYTVRLY